MRATGRRTTDAAGPARRFQLLRERVPPGLMAVAIGLAVNGITTYAFLVVAGRSLGPHAYAPLAATWALVILSGSGFFLPVEQEVSRAVAARHAQGFGGGPVVRRAGIAMLVMVSALLVAVAALSITAGNRVFDSQFLLVVGVGLALLGYGTEYLARGMLGGIGNFRAYGRIIAGEGVLRLMAALGIAVVGAAQAGPYGLALGLAPLLAVALVLSRERDLAPPGPPAEWREVSASLGWLVIGSVMSQVLLNGGPLAVKALAGPDEEKLAGQFLAGLVMTRVPLFFFQAAQAAVLPRLATLAASHRRDEFEAVVRSMMVVVAVVGAAMVIGAYVFGPAVVGLLFGDEFTLSRLDLALLGTSSAAFMAALAWAQALLAVGRYARAATSWLIGVPVGLAVLAADVGVLRRVELALVAGAAVAAIAMWAGVSRLHLAETPEGVSRS